MGKLFLNLTKRVLENPDLVSKIRLNSLEFLPLIVQKPVVPLNLDREVLVVLVQYSLQLVQLAHQPQVLLVDLSLLLALVWLIFVELILILS